MLCKVCGMQYNGQTNDKFRYRWNNYKDSNQKSLGVEDHKQAGFFANFQTAGDSDFINGTEVRFINKTGHLNRTSCEAF